MLKGKYLFESMKSTKPTEEFFKYIDIDSIDNRIGIVTAPKVLPSKMHRAEQVDIHVRGMCYSQW